jgi:hypothetical protein
MCRFSQLGISQEWGKEFEQVYQQLLEQYPALYKYKEKVDF